MQINYPDKKPGLRKTANTEEIFCAVRKQWMKLTPEEWVRQNFILFLTEVLGYPLSLVAVEKQIALQDVKKRFDIIVYDQQINPIILVECKEMNVPIVQSTLDQVLTYQSKIQARYFIITNGNQTHVFGEKNGQWMELNDREELNFNKK